MTHSRSRFRQIAGLLLLFVSAALHGQPVCGIDEFPDLRWSRAAALVDATTDTVLFETAGDLIWPPASLTKLVTLAVALDAAERGEFALHERLPVDRRSWASSQAPGSSLMFLGPDQLVSGEELLRGLMISSGNDAAVEISIRVAGSIGGFAARMNAYVRERGYSDWFFEEPAGLSPANRVTALEFAQLSAALIDEDPSVVERYFALPSFGYPTAANYPDGAELAAPIVQFNRNTLLETYEGADGLKTGFIEASQYNLAATAERDGRRLVAVVLGVPGDSHREGGQRRADEAATLLDFGFEAFERVTLVAPQPPSTRVWGGRREAVVAVVAARPQMTLARDVLERLEGRIAVRSDVWAPLAAGTVIGEATFVSGTCEVASVDLVIESELEQGSLWTRFVDRLVWWWTGLIGRR